MECAKLQCLCFVGMDGNGIFYNACSGAAAPEKAPSGRGLSKIGSSEPIFDWGREGVETISPSVIFCGRIRKK